MSPYEKAKQMYIDHGLGADDFDRDVEFHAKYGYILSTPLEFALYRPVCSEWAEEAQCYFEDELRLEEFELTLHYDSWHITVVVGELVDLLDQLPYHLPFLSMQRRGHYKRYNAKQIYEKAKNNRTRRTNTSSQRER